MRSPHVWYTSRTGWNLSAQAGLLHGRYDIDPVYPLFMIAGTSFGVTGVWMHRVPRIAKAMHSASAFCYAAARERLIWNCIEHQGRCSSRLRGGENAIAHH